MKKRVILTAGGTGGHLFPAQSLAHKLQDWDILFAAGGLSTNRYFARNQFAFEDISCSSLNFSKPLQFPRSVVKICRGIQQSRKLIRSFSPDLVVGFGSFFTLPILSAATFERIPIILHEQNTVPGKVNRLFSSIAHTMAITFPDTRHYLNKRGKQRAREVVFPLRERSIFSKAACWEYFGLKPALTTLLVFGGSQGAIRLNQLMIEAAPLLQQAIQIIHFTGNEKKQCRNR